MNKLKKQLLVESEIFLNDYYAYSKIYSKYLECLNYIETYDNETDKTTVKNIFKCKKFIKEFKKRTIDEFNFYKIINTLNQIYENGFDFNKYFKDEYIAYFGFDYSYLTSLQVLLNQCLSYDIIDDKVENIKIIDLYLNGHNYHRLDRFKSNVLKSKTDI